MYTGAYFHWLHLIPKGPKHLLQLSYALAISSPGKPDVKSITDSHYIAAFERRCPVQAFDLSIKRKNFGHALDFRLSYFYSHRRQYCDFIRSEEHTSELQSH